ncbi:putative SPEAR family protein [Helianthus anomalus]
MNYFGDAAGNERSAGASSSRKGKKSNSNKPRQPQRGLGVAQLEKIRLNQLEFYPSNLHPPVQIFQLNPPTLIILRIILSCSRIWYINSEKYLCALRLYVVE